MSSKKYYELELAHAAIAWYRELHQFVRSEAVGGMEQMAKIPEYDVTEAELRLYFAVRGYLRKGCRNGAQLSRRDREE